jgi:hypothetical protein
MDGLPGALAALPQLAPGIILGAVAGIAYGFYTDYKSDEDIPTSWWQLGGLGGSLGAVAWMVLLNIS